MDYSKLVAVTGLPGLYELINSKNDGAIIRSLDDNTTRFASSRIHNFSHLESIEVYTTGENVNLVDIFQAMEKGSGTLPDGKDNAVTKKYFEKVYPELDFDRVYASDLKKMVKWFDVLQKNKVELKLSELPEEEEEEEVEEAPKPAKKAAPAEKAEKAEKKTETKEVKETKKTKEDAPKAAAKKSAEKSSEKEEKKAAPKKKAAEKKEAPKKKAAPKKK
jgi:hypothetical protein